MEPSGQCSLSKQQRPLTSARSSKIASMNCTRSSPRRSLKTQLQPSQTMPAAKSRAYHEHYVQASDQNIASLTLLAKELCLRLSELCGLEPHAEVSDHYALQFARLG